jgi:hypothetical protein
VLAVTVGDGVVMNVPGCALLRLVAIVVSVLLFCEGFTVVTTADGKSDSSPLFHTTRTADIVAMVMPVTVTVILSLQESGASTLAISVPDKVL